MPISWGKYFTGKDIENKHTDSTFLLFKIMKQRAVNPSILSALEKTNSMEKSLTVKDFRLREQIQIQLQHLAAQKK